MEGEATGFALHLTEQEAHRLIEKRAMDRCVTRRVIAEEILADEK